MGAGKYRKRPVEVEAMQLDGTNYGEVAEWCGGEFYYPAASEGHVVVPTMHGDVVAKGNDWVIRGLIDFYPMTAEQFAQAFDPIDPLVAGITRLTREAYGNDLPVV